MKCNILILYLLCCLQIIQSLQTLKKKKKVEWEEKLIVYRGNKIKLLTLKSLDTSNADQILELIDRSFYNSDPTQVDSEYISIIKKQDLIVINEKLLFWFSASPKKDRITKTGGGLLAGIWELEMSENKLRLKPQNKKNFYCPNLLLTGSEPNIKIFSSDVFGGYADKKTTWGIENSMNLKEGLKMGKIILREDKGPYAGNGGLFVEFEGFLTNQRNEKGFETDYDTDPREGIIGKTKYNLIFRIPPNKMEIIQEIKFTAMENNFGPISAAYMSLYLPGHRGKEISWASNPELTPAGNRKKSSVNINLSNVSLNKYFRNTAVQKIYFYGIPYSKIEGKKSSARTAPGKGKILCLGSPENKINFMCGYPTNDFIPKNAYQEYSLEVTDNQLIPKIGKIHSLTYRLLTNPNTSVVLKQGESFRMIMRYKLIDASNAAAAQIKTK